MNQNKWQGKRIRKGDQVIAISGNYKGQTGTVLSRDADRAIVQGLNVRKKHLRPTQQGTKGNIIEREQPIHISNLKVCVGNDKPVKLKVRNNKKGERELCYQSGKKTEVYRSVKKFK